MGSTTMIKYRIMLDCQIKDVKILTGFGELSVLRRFPQVLAHNYPRQFTFYRVISPSTKINHYPNMSVSLITLTYHSYTNLWLNFLFPPWLAGRLLIVCFTITRSTIPDFSLCKLWHS